MKRIGKLGAFINRVLQRYCRFLPLDQTYNHSFGFQFRLFHEPTKNVIDKISKIYIRNNKCYQTQKLSGSKNSGNIKAYAVGCEKARQEAYDKMIQQARSLGALHKNVLEWRRQAD